MSVPKPLAGFTRMGSSTYNHEPQITTRSSPATAPDLIIIASWLDADPRHVAKYSNGFRELYPASRIVLIMSDLADFTYRSSAANIKRIEPIVATLISAPSDARILAAMYSNGGAITMSMVGEQFKARTGRPVPIQAVLLDSAPGVGTWAHLSSLPFDLPRNPILRIIASGVILTYLALAFTKLAITGGETPHEIARVNWNDKGLFDEDMKRLYVTSNSDTVVEAKYVREHYEDAKAKGWKVSFEQFEGSSHVGHMKADPDRYWRAVQSLWEM